MLRESKVQQAGEDRDQHSRKVKKPPVHELKGLYYEAQILSYVRGIIAHVDVDYSV